MTFTLRQYQIEAVQAGAQFMLSERKRNGLIVIPTGGGKSICIAETARQLDGPCLVFQPSKEILEQNLSKFHAYGYRPSVYSASLGKKTVGDITLATIGSVAGAKNRVSKSHLFRDFPYIILDEADLAGAKEGQYKSFFSELPNAKLLGYTATPYRLSSDSYGCILKFLTRTRPRIFDELIYYVDTGILFAEGYLSKLEYQVVKGFDRNAVKTNSTGADFDERALQLNFLKIGFSDKIVKVVKRLQEVGRKNALIFTRFVPEAEYVASQVEGCVVVTAETPKAEREAIGQEFRAGRIWGVINVGIYLCGFDYPELETVVLARPTRSLRVYYQQVGRAVRPCPTKESAWIVDMCQLSSEFGKIEDLKIVDGGNGKWFIENTERQITNVTLTASGSRCSKCGVPIGFWARHRDTGNAAPMQRPVEGMLPNIKIESVNGKTLYSVVKPGEGEFLNHYACCSGRG